MLSFAIDNHASDIHDALTPLQRGVARQFFLSLVERRDGRDVRRPQSLRELPRSVGNDAHDALMAVIEAFRAPGVGFVLPAAGQPIGPDDLIDISHESLIRRWRRFQAWLAEEDLDVAELKEWQQRARRRHGGRRLARRERLSSAPSAGGRGSTNAPTPSSGQRGMRGPGRTSLSTATSSRASSGPIRSRPSRRR